MKTKRLDEQDNFYYQCYICDGAIYEGTIIALVDKEIHHYVHSSCLWQVIRDNLFTNTTGYLKFVEKVGGRTSFFWINYGVEQTTLTIDDSGCLSPPGSVSPETKLHIKREESG